ncbi:MAG: tRNA (uridine(54)-C5)-methyltransferase TrmA [Arcobacteraceae bacterium]
MKCEYFSKCGSCTLFEYTYEEQLNYKVKIEKERFSSFNIDQFDIIKSQPEHFRSRAEFRIWKTVDEKEYMTLSYAMNDFNRNILQISSCSMVSPKIATLMPILLEALQQEEILKEKLFTIEFLSTQNDKTLVTLIYHKKLNETWTAKAKPLEEQLNIKIIGRSRGQKLILSEDFITNEFKIQNSKFKIQNHEGGFSQPNENVNTQMIAWVLEHIKSGGDLCELYCGGGNFTLPLSTKFNKVLATEISKTSIKSAKESCTLNNITNIEFVRMSAEEFVEALNETREFNRLKEIHLNDYSFSQTTNHQSPTTIFVDPPRAGLDETTRTLAKQFEQIIYISCNAQTLHRDLEELTKTHTIKHFALFDQFAFTKHIECGVILEKQN